MIETELSEETPFPDPTFPPPKHDPQEPIPIEPDELKWVMARVATAILLTALGDYLMYQSGMGYTGIAIWLAMVIAAVLLRFRSVSWNSATFAILGLVAVGCGRLVWQGNPIVVIGMLAMIGMLILNRSRCGLSLASLLPVPFSVVASSLTDSANAIQSTNQHFRIATQNIFKNVLLPIGIGFFFVLIFLKANPTLDQWFRDFTWKQYQNAIHWLEGWSLFEAGFWATVFVGSFGILSPRVADLSKRGYSAWNNVVSDKAGENEDSSWYVSVRNSLYVVVLVFATFVSFECYSIWRGGLPEGIGYSAYAHQGAFWLTIALAFATAFVCYFFRFSKLTSSQFERLQPLVLIWATINVLLCLCVYHRLWIYVDFDGLTRLRIVGFFGVTCVASGFVVVLYKVAHRRSMFWLFDRQLATLAFFGSLLAVTPVDWIAHRYNASRILDGDWSAAIHFQLQPMSAEGALALTPLSQHPNSTIRKAAQIAMLKILRQSESDDWRTWQGSVDRLEAAVQNDPSMNELDAASLLKQESEINHQIRTLVIPAS